jgi:hypothetical protein
MSNPHIARRDFLLFRSKRERGFELSCERLYMRYLDSIDECTTADLFESLERDLRGVTLLRLTCAGWLSREDFRAWLQPCLDQLKARGAQVVGD